MKDLKGLYIGDFGVVGVWVVGSFGVQGQFIAVE